jgi:hypothetical protein
MLMIMLFAPVPGAGLSISCSAANFRVCAHALRLGPSAVLDRSACMRSYLLAQPAMAAQRPQRLSLALCRLHLAPGTCKPANGCH